MNKTSPVIQTGLHDGPVAAADLTDWAASGATSGGTSGGGCGGECVFLGRTRDETHPEFGALQRLDYEAYPEMAARLLEQLARSLAAKHGCHAVRLVHAVGPVPVGQASVVIQALTPHRPAAFAACRELIDRLKLEVPIWKREVWEKGQTFVKGETVKTSG